MTQELGWFKCFSILASFGYFSSLFTFCRMELEMCNYFGEDRKTDYFIIF